MSVRHTSRIALKRGALVAASNWPVALVQSAADALSKLLAAAPLIGGAILASIVIGADLTALRTGDPAALASEIVSSLLQHGPVLAAFLASAGLMIVGASLFVFLVKGGTMGTMVRGERQAGPVEIPPLQPAVLATAGAFSIESFVDSARSLFPRYARLGLGLMAVYLASGMAFVAAVFAGPPVGEGWGYTSVVTVGFVIWITLVNLVYLLMQVVIAADDCGLAVAGRRVATFLRYQVRNVAAVFVVMLGTVVLATGASLTAITLLGFVALVPLVGFVAMPLQLLAFLLRAIVLQYIDLLTVGAYLTLYREFSAAFALHRQQVAPAWAPPADVPHA